MDLQHLIAEVRRRRVIRALIAYGIAAFAVLQIIEPVMHGLRWPDVVLSYVVVALGCGFPIVAAFAWIYDIRAGRIERTVSSSHHAPWMVGAVLGIGLLAAVPGLFIYFVVLGGSRGGNTEKHGSAPAAAASIAVLPFVNMSGDKDNEYFSDGITEEIIGALANVEGLRVAARTSAFAFKGKNITVQKIGEELNVATVLEGSVRRSGSELRIVAQLIDVRTGYHLWTKTYDRQLSNVFQLEDELARSIAQALRIKLMPSAEGQLAKPYTANLEAHDLYLQGLYLWNRRSGTSLLKAIAFFQSAIERDPGYTLAYVGLADSLTVLPVYGWVSVPEVIPRAKAAARRALELDDQLAEAHGSLCLAILRDFAWDAAERECHRALELKPEYPTAHQWYAIVLHSVGRVQDALAEARRARQLDPVSPIINSFVALELYLNRDYSSALDQARKTLDVHPTFSLGHSFLALIDLQLNRPSDAVAELEPLMGQSNRYEGELGYAYAVAHRRQDAVRLLARMSERAAHEYVAPSARVLVHLGLGDKEQALSWLEKGLSEFDWRLLYLKADPLFDPLRSEPRFGAILEKMHLAPQTTEAKASHPR